MRKYFGLVLGIAILSVNFFSYGANCTEIQNSIEVGDECYCEKGFTWNDGKTGCSKIDTSLRDDELKKAIERMYENGLTQYNTPELFKSDDYLTREQASKFFVTFYSKILGKNTAKDVNLNIFSDMDEANPDLKVFIAKASDIGLFKGFKGKFMPKNKLTQAQAIAVVIRMVNGSLEQVKNTWYVNYYDKAKKYGLLKRGYFDIVDLDRINITRGDTALLLYTLYNNRINNKDHEKLTNYNNDLAKALNKCLDVEDENISTFQDGTEDEMNNAIAQILGACKESAKEVYNIGPWSDDDSLQNAVLTVISYNISFYDKAKKIVPYKRIKDLTEIQKAESDKIDRELEDLIKKFDKSYEDLKVIQKEFSDNYNF